MGTIKGENLRLFINGKCVAAALTCSAHIATQIESMTTKDSEGVFDEQEPVGLSWDMSSEALVTDGIEEAYGSSQADRAYPFAEGITTYTNGETYTLHPQESLHVVTQTRGFFAFEWNGHYSMGAPIESGESAYTNTTGSDMKVVIMLNSPDEVKKVWKTDDRRTGYADLYAAQTRRTEIEASFAIADGRAHADKKESVLTGRGYIADMQLNAQNRQNATLSIQITGTGPLGDGNAKTLEMPAGAVAVAADREDTKGGAAEDEAEHSGPAQSPSPEAESPEAESPEVETEEAETEEAETEEAKSASTRTRRASE